MEFDYPHPDEEDDYDADEHGLPMEFCCCLPDCLQHGLHFKFECFNAEMVEAHYEEMEKEC